MADPVKNFIIGLFVLAALGIIIFVILFLNPTTGDEGKVLRARFADVDKVTVGTRVNFAGKPVGEVTAIRELQDAITERRSHDGFIYVYELELKVDSSVNVFNTDEISVRTSGLLGERSIAITPRPPRPGEKLRIVNNDILYATETSSVEDTLKEFKELSDKVEEVLDGVIDALSTMKDKGLWENVAKSGKNIEEFTATLNQPDKINEILENFGTLSELLVELGQKANTSWKTVDESLVNVRTMTEDTKGIVVKIKGGEGSMGQILAKEDFYLQIKSLLSKADTTMNDINHYGVLFHLDKGWQRMRARRLNLLNRLSNPQEFRNFFNDEMDQISTSLSRVYMLLDSTTDPCNGYSMFDECEYNKVFAEVLRKIAIIEENLNMYNQQRMQEQVYQTELSPCGGCS